MARLKVFRRGVKRGKAVRKSTGKKVRVILKKKAQKRSANGRFA